MNNEIIMFFPLFLFLFLFISSSLTSFSIVILKRKQKNVFEKVLVVGYGSILLHLLITIDR